MTTATAASAATFQYVTLLVIIYQPELPTTSFNYQPLRIVGAPTTNYKLKPLSTNPHRAAHYRQLPTTSFYQRLQLEIFFSIGRFGKGLRPTLINMKAFWNKILIFEGGILEQDNDINCRGTDTEYYYPSRCPNLSYHYRLLPHPPPTPGGGHVTYRIEKGAPALPGTFWNRPSILLFAYGSGSGGSLPVLHSG